MVSVWPVVPSSTSWWATTPRSRTECTGMSPGPLPPRAPGTTSVVVGSGAHESLASAKASMTIDGKQWGVPYTYDQWGIYFNKDTYKAARVDVPKPGPRNNAFKSSRSAPW